MRHGSRNIECSSDSARKSKKMGETLNVKHNKMIVGALVETKHNVPNNQKACKVLRE